MMMNSNEPLIEKLPIVINWSVSKLASIRNLHLIQERIHRQALYRSI